MKDDTFQYQQMMMMMMMMMENNNNNNDATYVCRTIVNSHQPTTTTQTSMFPHTAKHSRAES